MSGVRGTKEWLDGPIGTENEIDMHDVPRIDRADGGRAAWNPGGLFHPLRMKSIKQSENILR